MRFITIVDKVALYGSTIWLILSFIVPFFRKTWYMFIILTIIHFLINKKWKSAIRISLFFIGIRLLALVLPVWILQVVGVVLMIYLFWHYKKIIDTQGGTIYSEAQVMSAKAQLVLVKKLKAKGHTVSDDFIKDLEDVINGKKTPDKGKIKRIAKTDRRKT